jgi:hypothetical protein
LKNKDYSEVLELIHNVPTNQNLAGLMNQLGPKCGKLFDITMELYLMLLEALQTDPEGVVNGSIASQIESFLEAVKNNLELNDDELKLLAPLVAILIVAIKSSTLSFLFSHPDMHTEGTPSKSNLIN